MSISHVSQIECATCYASLEALINLAQANNLTVFELFQRVQELPSEPPAEPNKRPYRKRRPRNP
jgi:hypothetical protein